MKFAVILICNLCVLSKWHGSTGQRPDLHKSMDNSELHYYFNVDQTHEVPRYDLITPRFDSPYRGFPQLSKRKHWIHPQQLDFKLKIFRKNYVASAVRNDVIATRGFKAKYVGTNQFDTAEYKPHQSVLRRHYLAVVHNAEMKNIGSDKVNGAFSASPEGLHGLFKADNRYFRIKPVRRKTLSRYAPAFDSDIHNRDLHIVYEIAKPTAHQRVRRDLFHRKFQNYQFARNADNSTKKSQNLQLSRLTGTTTRSITTVPQTLPPIGRINSTTTAKHPLGGNSGPDKAAIEAVEQKLAWTAEKHKQFLAAQMKKSRAAVPLQPLTTKKPGTPTTKKSLLLLPLSTSASLRLGTAKKSGTKLALALAPIEVQKPLLPINIQKPTKMTRKPKTSHLPSTKQTTISVSTTPTTSKTKKSSKTTESAANTHTKHAKPKKHSKFSTTNAAGTTPTTRGRTTPTTPAHTPKTLPTAMVFPPTPETPVFATPQRKSVMMKPVREPGRSVVATTAKPKGPDLHAAMVLGVIADFTMYSSMLTFGLVDPEKQIFYLLSFYNEVQAFFKEPFLAKQVDITISLKSIGFMTNEKNDLGADEYATQYLDNICKGPYNLEEYDHLQALTMLDIYDVNGEKRFRQRRNAEARTYPRNNLHLPEKRFDQTHRLPSAPPFKDGVRRKRKFFDASLQPARRKDRDTFKPKKSVGNFTSGKKMSDRIGMALLGSTCDKALHCTVIEMNSFAPSMSAAHELTHTMGVNHEGPNGCMEKENPTSFMLAAHDDMKTGWTQFAQLPVMSTCGIRELITFLQGNGRCLVKKAPPPEDGFQFKRAFTKILHHPFTADDVCKLRAGPVFIKTKKWQHPKIVAEKGNVPGICKSLTCGGRETVGPPNGLHHWVFGPAPPGTQCESHGHVCHNFQCVDKAAILELYEESARAG